ncbi:LLM class F420-dependent oxidoreductase [Mycolicibacterium confluentis]|uniref:LLM class F420-dependent oxidoreductase n=1 Tax=Mycolicibacterium confluentis TaxID=28047 RepID=A0A7I7XZ50_9MYCO|nr:LLM class F420-dependent oxidoreductase [Mycolicibacterium confluentis]MCV7319548.1 LLM class F420-dependent oxidoreductase [Mycolicibacterium confluentis]ORV34172.1 LLM class F420-dependent oxidoreductase [Mycolicibacterium confluentis]BBZ34569.1 LLM class F420-dependent oxidoreductase [Mycolicibacterium confluentis]
MRIGTVLDFGRPMAAVGEEIAAWEEAGLASVTLGEAYSLDAPTQLAYLAARTTSVELATGVLPLDTRTPTLIATTAAGLDYVSNGRARLGLGPSGPQVVEGFHGIPFADILGKTRETIEICRSVWRRETLKHDGRHYQIPMDPSRGTGLGKPLKLINRPVRSDIPISIASLGPRMVELTAELAQGWEPIFFYPEKLPHVWGEALAKGNAKRSDDLGPLEIIVRAPLAITEGDPSQWIDAAKPQLALYVGGMGSREKNFYNQLVSAYGFADEAAVIQDHFLAGRIAEATAAVPDELVRATSLIGDADHIRQRLTVLRDAGVTLVNVTPMTTDPTERLEAVRTAATLSKEIS